MNDFYKSNVNNKYTLAKKCLDVVNLNMNGRIVKVSPLICSDSVIAGKDNKYLPDRLSLLYIAMSTDRSVKRYKATNDVGVTIVGLNLILALPNKDSLSVKLNRESIFYNDEVTIGCYIFKMLFLNTNYKYPLALINNRTKVGVLKENGVNILYAYLTTELKLENIEIPFHIEDQINTLRHIGEDIDSERRRIKLNYDKFSKLLAIVNYTMMLKSNSSEVRGASIEIYKNVIEYDVNLNILVNYIITYLKAYRAIVVQNKHIN